MQKKLWNILRPAGLGALALGLFAIGTMHPANATVTFNGDWTNFGKNFTVVSQWTIYDQGKPVEFLAGSKANEWRNIQEYDLSRIVAVKDPTSPLKGFVGKVEVLPGDSFGHPSDRAEISHMIGKAGHFDVNGTTGHEFVAIAVKLDPAWQPPQKHNGAGPIWGVILQAHSPDVYNSSPAISLGAEGDFHLKMCAGDVWNGGATKVNKDNLPYKFSNGSLVPGHWVLFVFDINWAYDNKGGIAVYRRDEGQTTFTKVLDRQGVPTLQFRTDYAANPDSAGVHYFKAGYYRSGGNFVSRMWLGPVVRATTFSEAAVAAFGKP